MNPPLARRFGSAAAFVIAAVAAAPALALDLRTSVYQHNWTSVYVGGQVGWSRVSRQDRVGLRPTTEPAPLANNQGAPEGEGSEDEKANDRSEGDQTKAKSSADRPAACAPGWIVSQHGRAAPLCDRPAKPLYGGETIANRLTSDAVGGGLHIGALYQMGKWVIGAEGRIDWAGHDAAACNEPSKGCVSSTTNWYGAGIAKLGFARERTLVYASLGIAVASADTRAINLFAEAPHGFTASQTMYGLAYGGGLSYALNNHWILTADYLRYDFSNQADNVAGLAVDHKLTTTIDTVTARLSYHIGY